MEILYTKNQKKRIDRNKLMVEDFKALREQHPEVSKFRCSVTLAAKYNISIVTVINVLKKLKVYD